MNYSKIPLAQTVVTLCKWHGISHIIISPGSRNAPLTIGFTHDDYFSCYSIVDERCAAFFALGIAQQTNTSVALVCTSGSALLNYYPAISEAFYSNIPLVVLSADRPECLVDIGDGQTIKQSNVYGEHVHFSANLKLDLKEDVSNYNIEEATISESFQNDSQRLKELTKGIQSFNENQIKTALEKAKKHSGPVHLNVPFDEPLYERTNKPISLSHRLKAASTEKEFNEYDINSYIEKWQSAKRKMILVGELPPNSIEEKWLNIIAEDDSVLVFTETTSNLNHDQFFPGIDKIIAPLNENEFQALQPQVLLTLGGMVVSKKIKAFLRKYKPQHHWHVGPYKANDTFFCLEKHFKMQPNAFMAHFLPKLSVSVKSDYKNYWLQIRFKRRHGHELYLKNIPFSDFVVFNALLKSLPIKSILQVGNSSAIRYTQLFQLSNDIKVYCNRGTSGIDGSTSTAIGCSAVSKERTTFITGDLSFFYDSNALWNSYIPNSFRIIVVNNNGGGIFRILPGHKNTENFDTYFETKHQLSAQQLCEMYGVEYASAHDESSLSNNLNSFYDISKSPKLLEVFTPSTSNDTVLLEYFNFIR